ncbi:hypothetical protein PBY51_018596 [Eleginops maclovinus]|uniref:Uncharacterized protein n=1 Tax=Eleginops maclovinus TaxID=56733 RepID=A0AAN7Y7B7_ELEMC|nr:hypothetical protein PBY51_018596 [Eleginops maclovinus]
MSPFFKPPLITTGAEETPLQPEQTSMCVSRRGDAVIVAAVRRDERINGSSGLMEGGGPACSELSGASWTPAGRNPGFHVPNGALLISASDLDVTCSGLCM